LPCVRLRPARGTNRISGEFNHKNRIESSGQVINERTDSFQGKCGRVENQVFSLPDMHEHPMLDTVDYGPSDDENAKHSGQLVGRRVLVAVADAKTDFGGWLRLRGRIVDVK
jgi:hypothetical protein